MQISGGEDTTFYLTIVIKDYPGLSPKSLMLQEFPQFQTNLDLFVQFLNSWCEQQRWGDGPPVSVYLGLSEFQSHIPGSLSVPGKWDWLVTQFSFSVSFRALGQEELSSLNSENKEEYRIIGAHASGKMSLERDQQSNKSSRQLLTAVVK